MSDSITKCIVTIDTFFYFSFNYSNSYNTKVNKDTLKYCETESRVLNNCKLNVGNCLEHDFTF